MENLGYLLQDDDIPQAVKRRSVKEKSKSVQLENVSKKYLFAKRAIDVILSFCAVAVLSVPMLLIALVVFLQDFHNPIFKQVRVTKDGRFFTMYKFRTMCVNAEQKLEELRSQNEADGPVFKMKKDPRVTPIGGFLRKTSLDELPQFFNVLNGSMSLVGPFRKKWKSTPRTRCTVWMPKAASPATGSVPAEATLCLTSGLSWI